MAMYGGPAVLGIQHGCLRQWINHICQGLEEEKEGGRGKKELCRRKEKETFLWEVDRRTIGATYWKERVGEKIATVNLESFAKHLFWCTTFKFHFFIDKSKVLFYIKLCFSHCGLQKTWFRSVIFFCHSLCCYTLTPNQQWHVACKMESSGGIYSHCTHIFACLAPICMISRWLVNKISASELSRKFIKSALLVGQA